MSLTVEIAAPAAHPQEGLSSVTSHKENDYLLSLAFQASGIFTQALQTRWPQFVVQDSKSTKVAVPRTLEPCSRTNRSEEHTSELQSRQYLVCRLLLEKKKKLYISTIQRP